MHTHLQTSIIAETGTAVLQPIGRLDSPAATQLVDWIEQEVDDHVAKVVIDLRKVHHVDSAALNILMRGERHCRAKNANLVLCSPQLPVRMMFALTQYDNRFRIYDDIVTAFNALFH